MTRLLLIIIFFLQLDMVYNQNTCGVRRWPCYCESIKNLGGLRFNCNAKTEIPTGFPSSTRLINLQKNNVRTVKTNAFGNLTNLRILRLDGNRMKTIEPRAFYGVTALNELYLSDNDLKQIPGDIIDPAAPLASGIRLDKNNLTAVPVKLLWFTKKKISVQNNPIHCGCSAVLPIGIRNNIIGTCSSPQHVKGKTISSLTYSDVNCGKCEQQKCQYGSCYLNDRGDPMCECFPGYLGVKCGLFDNHVKNLVTTKPTTLVTTKTTTLRGQPKDNGSTDQGLMTPHIIIIISIVIVVIILGIIALVCYKKRHETTIKQSTKEIKASDNESFPVYEEITRPLPSAPKYYTPNHQTKPRTLNDAHKMHMINDLSQHIKTNEPEKKQTTCHECSYEIDPETQNEFVLKNSQHYEVNPKTLDSDYEQTANPRQNYENSIDTPTDFEGSASYSYITIR